MTDPDQPGVDTGTDVQWLVAEIERLTADKALWHGIANERHDREVMALAEAIAQRDAAHERADRWSLQAQEQEVENQRLLAERDAQVREAFMAGWAAYPEHSGDSQTDAAFAAYLATRERPTGPEAGK